MNNTRLSSLKDKINAQAIEVTETPAEVKVEEKTEKKVKIKK